MNYRELKDNRKIEGSKEIRDRVNRAREIQYHRYKEDNIFSNSELESRSIKKYCRLTPEAESIFKKAFNKYKFSARSYDKILKVARTIADLDEKDIISEIHILEAIRYRTLDNKYWG